MTTVCTSWPVWSARHASPHAWQEQPFARGRSAPPQQHGQLCWELACRALGPRLRRPWGVLQRALLHPSWTSLDNTSLEGRRIRLLADAAGLDPDDGETFFWVFAFLLFDYVFVCYVYFFELFSFFWFLDFCSFAFVASVFVPQEIGLFLSSLIDVVDWSACVSRSMLVILWKESYNMHNNRHPITGIIISIIMIGIL